MSIRVVIAEDEAIIRLDLKETLEEEGYIVVGETGRGDKAVELVRELRPDLAILDIKMPEMDGHETLKKIKKLLTKSIKIPIIIAITAIVIDKNKEYAQYIKEGFNDLIIKPYKNTEITTVINKFFKN